MFGFVFLFQFINDPGLQSHNSIYLSNNKDKIAEYFPRLLGLKLLLFSTLALVVAFFGLLFKYEIQDFDILLGIVGIFFLSTMFFLIRTSLSAYELYRIDTWLSSLDRFFLILALGTLILSKYPISLELYIGVQLSCYILCNMIALFIIKRKIKINIFPIVDVAFCKSHLKSSLSFALVILLTAIVSRVDGVMIERLLSEGEKLAGEYAAGYRFIDASNMLGVLYGGLLLPMYANRFAANESIDEVFSIAFRMLLLASLLAGLTFYFYAEDIFGLIYKEALRQNIDSLKFLFLAIIPIMLTNAFGPILLAAKYLKNYNYMYAATAFFIVVANFILLPIYELKAASMIVFIAWCAILIFKMIACHKIGKIHFERTLILKSIFALSISILIYFIFENMISLDWKIEIILCPLIITSMCVLSGYIGIKEVLKSR